MIVHEVTIDKQPANQPTKESRKKIYVGCATPDIPYKEMLVNFRQRWEFYTRHRIDFLTIDQSGLAPDQCKRKAEEAICQSDGVMVIVSKHTACDALALWEIDCALSNAIPTVGVDIRKTPDEHVPPKLVGKMTKYGWEWFAAFMDGL